MDPSHVADIGNPRQRVVGSFDELSHVCIASSDAVERNERPADSPMGAPSIAALDSPVL